MQINYYKEWSNYLGREMEFKVFGHGGRPVVVFPCLSGRFYDWENFGMVEKAAWWIDRGEIQRIPSTRKAGTIAAANRAAALKCRKSGSTT